MGLYTHVIIHFISDHNLLIKIKIGKIICIFKHILEFWTKK